MTDDLVARLRNVHAWQELCHEAADEIERLRAERDALRDALIGICIKCRSNEWGADTPRKTILNWMHDTASAAIDTAIAATSPTRDPAA